jgi:hypothetical protein
MKTNALHLAGVSGYFCAETLVNLNGGHGDFAKLKSAQSEVSFVAFESLAIFMNTIRRDVERPCEGAIR